MNQSNTQYEMGFTDTMEDTNDSSIRGLSKMESRLFKALAKIKGETLIAISIRERLQCGSLGGFREMITELKQQYSDCGRERMIEVFGIDAVKLLEVL